MGPVGPRWAPCWPHETCYPGNDSYITRILAIWAPQDNSIATKGYYKEQNVEIETTLKLYGDLLIALGVLVIGKMVIVCNYV